MKQKTLRHFASLFLRTGLCTYLVCNLHTVNNGLIAQSPKTCLEQWRELSSGCVFQQYTHFIAYSELWLTKICNGLSWTLFWGHFHPSLVIWCNAEVTMRSNIENNFQTGDILKFIHAFIPLVPREARTGSSPRGELYPGQGTSSLKGRHRTN